jgi:hypothetical protein
VTHVIWHVWERGEGAGKRYVQGRGGETDLKETDHLDDLDVADRMIRVLKRSVDQPCVSQDREKWCAVVNTGINRRVQTYTQHFLTRSGTVIFSSTLFKHNITRDLLFLLQSAKEFGTKWAYAKIKVFF